MISITKSLGAVLSVSLMEISSDYVRNLSNKYSDQAKNSSNSNDIYKSNFNAQRASQNATILSARETDKDLGRYPKYNDLAHTQKRIRDNDTRREYPGRQIRGLTYFK